MSDPRQGLVFDVQRFSVHDGPGVRTTVFFKGCPLRCPWCQNPESLRPDPELAFYADRCHRDASCLAACPRGALRAGDDRVARDACDACGLCVPACPHGALRRVGRWVAVDALADEVARDEPFFAASGGGVTLSGGEPTYQLGFATAFARALRSRGIGCGLQTCGAFSWDAFEPVRADFEFIFFDLKIIASAGGAILQNARRIAQSGPPVVFRMAVVGGYTDTPDNLRAIAELLRECGTRSIHLLAYHPMGESKLGPVGDPLPRLQVRDPLPARALLERAAARLKAENIEVST